MVQNERGSPAQAKDSEELARLVLACRELSLRIDTVLEQLPDRREAPFLYGQLDAAVDGLRRLLGRLSEDEEQASLLKQLLGGRKKRPPASEPGADLQGNAWTIPVAELVNFLAHAQKSGVLHVTTQHETFLLEFSHGSLMHASSNASPPELRIGAILEREGLLVPDELERNLIAAAEAEDLLGSFLVRRGRISADHLRRVLALQTQELFHRLMDARNAVYRFQEGVRLLHSQNLEVNIVQLLLESARKKDEVAMGAAAESRPMVVATEPEQVFVGTVEPAPLDDQPALLPREGATAADTAPAEKVRAAGASKASPSTGSPEPAG